MRELEYSTIRPMVRSGDVLAFEPSTFFGRAISKWTGSRYAHVGIAMWLAATGAEPRLFLLESRGGTGVAMRLLSGVGSCWYLPTNIQWTVEVNQFIWPRLGNAHYDWRSIFRRVFFRRAKRDGRYFCSEFVGEVLIRGGFRLRVESFDDPGTLIQDVLRFGPGQMFWLDMSEDEEASPAPEMTTLTHQIQPDANFQMSSARNQRPSY